MNTNNGWLTTVTQMKALAAELIRAAETMGGDDDESADVELVLSVAKPDTVTDDDGVSNAAPILTVHLAEYPEEGVYPIDPQDPTGGRVDTPTAAPGSPASTVADEGAEALTLAQKYEDACIAANSNARDAGRYRKFRAALCSLDTTWLDKVQAALEGMGLDPDDDVLPTVDQVDAAFDSASQQGGE